MPFILANWRYIIPALMAVAIGWLLVVNADLRADIANAKADKERELKEAAQQVIALKEQDAAQTRAWLDSWLTQRSKIEEEYLDAKARLAATPASSVCTTSPAGRAFIDGVWRQGGSAPANPRP